MVSAVGYVNVEVKVLPLVTVPSARTVPSLFTNGSFAYNLTL